jgi:hypothetical protein
MRQKIFLAYECAAKIISRPLSVLQMKLANFSNYATPTEYAAKIIPRPLSMRQKFCHAY